MASQVRKLSHSWKHVGRSRSVSKHRNKVSSVTEYYIPADNKVLLFFSLWSLLALTALPDEWDTNKPMHTTFNKSARKQI